LVFSAVRDFFLNFTNPKKRKILFLLTPFFTNPAANIIVVGRKSEQYRPETAQTDMGENA